MKIKDQVTPDIPAALLYSKSVRREVPALIHADNSKENFWDREQSGGNLF